MSTSLLPYFEVSVSTTPVSWPVLWVEWIDFSGEGSECHLLSKAQATAVSKQSFDMHLFFDDRHVATYVKLKPVHNPLLSNDIKKQRLQNVVRLNPEVRSTP